MATNPAHTDIDPALLAARLTDAITRSGSGGEVVGWLWPVLLRALAGGHPLTVDDLAHTSGRSPDEVRDGLSRLCDTEYDEHGRVVGHGITLRPTPHEFTVAGRLLYTWCALDTLIFPTVLDRAATIVSPTPGSGKLVRLSVDPAAGVTALHPATTVVSVVVPDPTASGVRSAFCDQVHFFATPADAQSWEAAHPTGTVLEVAHAFDLGRHLATSLLDGQPGGCC